MQSVVVILSGDAAVCGSVRKLVGDGGRVSVVDSAAAALATARTEGADLAIIDTEATTTAVPLIMSELRHWRRDLPVAVVGPPDITEAVRLMKAGASDYLAKPLAADNLQRHLIELLARARATVGSLTDSTVQQEAAPAAICGFRIQRALGQGSSGGVYLATSPSGEPCALKLMGRRDDVDDRTTLQRFQREAAALSRLRHPNIVRILEYGVFAGGTTPFIAMEYVEGTSLHKLLARGIRWSTRQRAWIIEQIANALTALEDAGLCHRDIKPSNILVSEDGTAKLLDFGAVRLPDSELTCAGRVIGTPAYMAPEAFMSSQVDIRSDIFSLGVVGYELIVGAPPFTEAEYMQRSTEVMTKRPLEPRKQKLLFPQGLQQIMARMLKKAPAERYASAYQLLDALETWRRPALACDSTVMMRNTAPAGDWT
jgi:serine/threonine-protein kinase